MSGRTSEDRFVGKVTLNVGGERRGRLIPTIQLTRTEQRSHQRRTRWVEKYTQLVELHRQKRSGPAITRELSLDRGTVRRWLQAGCLPERVGRPQHNRIGTWAEYLKSWSNRQTEGQVNRLKLIKRQMFGRAKFDLLRCRVLYRQL